MDFDVERIPGDGLQWVRPLPPGRQSNRIRYIEERRRRANDHRVSIEPFEREDGSLDIPSFQDIERLLGIYVATGEGRGAYLAAQESQEIEDRLYAEELEEYFLRNRQRYGFPSVHISGSSSGSSSDGDNGGRPSGRPPTGPQDGPFRAYNYLARQRPPISIQRSSFAGPDHTEFHRMRERERDLAELERLRRQSQRRSGSGPQESRVDIDLHIDRDGPIRSRQRYEQPYVVEGSGDDDDHEYEPPYTELPPEENDRRLHSQTDTHGRRRSSRGQQTDEEQVDQRVELEIREPQDRRRPVGGRRREHVDRRDRGPEYRNNSGLGLRGAGLTPDEVYRLLSSDGDAQSMVRLRGGGPAPPGLPTKYRSFVAGLLPKGTVIAPRKISLFFFCTSRGKIISSRQKVSYTTFQELMGVAPNNKTQGQVSDVWFIDMLHRHYQIIKRRRQSVFWDMLSLKTIGFATFIRFERTVGEDEDPAGYIVSGRTPAVSAEGEGESQFRHLLKNPMRSSKIMLLKLDLMVATTSPQRPGFYVVEIKEVPETTKIFFYLGLLILISTAGGAAYAVLHNDVGTGVSIASYVLACLSLILGLVAVGEWIGLSKPNSFSFAYDVENNQVLGATYVEQAFRSRS